MYLETERKSDGITCTYRDSRATKLNGSVFCTIIRDKGDWIVKGIDRKDWLQRWSVLEAAQYEALARATEYEYMIADEN